VKEIALTQGKVAIIDDEDYELVSLSKWHFHKRGYAVTQRQGRQYRLHQLIIQSRDGLMVDHINRDKLDNRRCNLRLVDKSVNNRNRDPEPRSSSGIKGVHWHPSSRKWQVSLMANGRREHFGTYENKHEAARVSKEVYAKLFPGVYISD
jgi:hypothetical protein